MGGRKREYRQSHPHANNSGYGDRALPLRNDEPRSPQPPHGNRRRSNDRRPEKQLLHHNARNHGHAGDVPRKRQGVASCARILRTLLRGCLGHRKMVRKQSENRPTHTDEREHNHDGQGDPQRPPPTSGRPRAPPHPEQRQPLPHQRPTRASPPFTARDFRPRQRHRRYRDKSRERQEATDGDYLLDTRPLVAHRARQECGNRKQEDVRKPEAATREAPAYRSARNRCRSDIALAQRCHHGLLTVDSRATNRRMNSAPSAPPHATGTHVPVAALDRVSVTVRSRRGRVRWRPAASSATSRYRRTVPSTRRRRGAGRGRVGASVRWPRASPL